MSFLNLKTIIDQSDKQKTYFLFDQSDFDLDKNSIVDFAKKTYQETSDRYQLNRQQKVLTQLLKKYPKASICLLTIRELEDKKKVTVCGVGDFVCQIKKTDRDYLIPVLKKGLSGYLKLSEKVIIDFAKPETLEIQPEPRVKKEKKVKTKKVKKPILNLSKFKNKLPKLKPIKNTKVSAPSIQITRHQKHFLSKKRIWALVLAGAFLFLLGVAIAYGTYRQKQFELTKQQEQLVEDISYRLRQAETLKDLNPARAKTLLAESQSILFDYQQQNTLSDELASLSDQIDQAYESVSAIFRSDLDLFYDLSLITTPFKTNSLDLSDTSLSIFDSTNQIILELNIDKKNGQIIAGKDLVKAGSQITSIDDWVFIYTGTRVEVLDKVDKEILSSAKLNTITPDQIVGYGSNLYAMDRGEGQIYRFRGKAKTIDKAQEFFSEPLDLAPITHFAVDGSVWLLDESGGLHQFTQGIKDAYYPDYGLDLPLGVPGGFFTDEYCGDIYIWDPDNYRIIAVSKTGSYQGQYSHPDIADISDFVVSEEIGKILLAKDDKIFSIDLK